MAKNSKNNYQ